MKLTEVLMWSGLTVSAISFGMEGTANGFEYAAETRGSFVTQPAFRQVAEQSRDFRDAFGLAAVAQMAGAGAIYASQAGLRRRTQ